MECLVNCWFKIELKFKLIKFHWKLMKPDFKLIEVKFKFIQLKFNQTQFYINIKLLPSNFRHIFGTLVFMTHIVAKLPYNLSVCIRRYYIYIMWKLFHCKFATVCIMNTKVSIYVESLKSIIWVRLN